MIFFYAISIILMFFVFPCKIKLSKDLNGKVIYMDYLSKENTLPIKGFFVATVLFSHSKGYIMLESNFFDNAFSAISSFLGQLIVVMFLFYSGYGIYESYKRKGNEYVEKFMHKRFFPTWLNFAVCIILYIALNLLLSIKYSTTDVLLSFIGWSSIGNSNWYMFVTFALYILFFISFMILKKGPSIIKIVLFSLLSFALLIFLYYIKESWWWNTIPCFVAGMWYSYFKEKIDTFVSDNNLNYAMLLMTCLLLFVVSFFIKDFWEPLYCLYSVGFGLLIVILSMKVKFNSICCSFLGNHVFSIYILQRIVFILLDNFGISDNKWLFVCLSYPLVIVLSITYDYLFEKCRLILLKNKTV